MEGPSLVIACEEFADFIGRKVDSVKAVKSEFKSLKTRRFKRARSWGKHFLLDFEGLPTIRIHFLMFGSYRINNPREARDPKLSLKFGRDRIDFYSCAIKFLEEDARAIYDWSIDLMSPQWDSKKALQQLRAREHEQVCDLLLDQDIFAGSGNIVKNEVLFNLHLHPESRFEALSSAEQRAFVKETHEYCQRFYEWKKANVFKRNWRIMRKRVCPRDGGKVTKTHTGKLNRVSHFCVKCQELLVAKPAKDVGQMKANVKRRIKRAPKRPSSSAHL